jgi:hypothetical protein
MRRRLAIPGCPLHDAIEEPPERAGDNDDQNEK